jgi:glutamyl-tRNA synthetase
MSQIRTRFAPSPTGYLHIGGARTALFNFLFARHHGGQFILRIEDTDRERSTPQAIQAILDAMQWLALDYDDGPHYQTARLALYKEKIQELLAKGQAYPCICTASELDAKRQLAMKEKRKPSYDGTCRPPEGAIAELPKGRPFTVRFRSPRAGTTVVRDAVKGDVIFDNRELDDLIIARSDGTPTYNFCVVVDDIDMAITHVIRGDDHLANTPRQIQLYQAFGAELPQFAHVPLILGTDKARLSKRHGATSVTAYRDMGYLPEAVVNYLVRLGWSYGDQEIFSRAELIEKFSLESVGKSAGVFNAEKFLWLNSHYLKSRPLGQLADDIVPYIRAAGYPVPQDKTWLERMIRTLQDRVKTLVELVDSARYYLTDEITIDEKAVKKFLIPEIAAPLQSLIERLSAIDDFSAAAIEREFTAVLEQHGLNMGHLAQPVRVALTGSTVSPGIHDVIAVLGKERTLRRLRSALQSLGLRDDSART